jgi:tetratricopeptide (TPR) repeat protein
MLLKNNIIFAICRINNYPMRIFLLFLILVFGGMCIAQTSPTSLKKLGNAGSKTWAVVVGISDYQDEDIPDLRFAHKDAEAFALWLESPAGGDLDADHLHVLLNDQATAGRVAEALDALLERVQENDKVFVYFSGHGDVERKTLSQPGFLLCWDAPSRVYMGGGTYSLAYLQEVVATLSVQNKAKVTVIADACRAGKLAGSQVGGPQLTSANLQRQQANELKILSCQAEEYSLEGTQWGSGRGVFSYHLMDGLYGLADRNNDGVVTLGELDRYLEDHVTAQAAPISQVPVLLGNKTENIAIIHEETLADLNRIKSGDMVYLAATDSRGLEDEVLANLDSNIIEQFRAFKEAVKEKRFFPSSENEKLPQTADELYVKLIAEPGLSPLYGAMTRNYAAALQDDVQQSLNDLLKSKQDPTPGAQPSGPMPPKINKELPSFPRCLERAAEILGKDHYMYSALKARQLFFEGYVSVSANLNQSQNAGEKALTLYRQSLAWQPEQPHVYWQMSQVFGYNLRQPDSLEHYTRLAMELLPNWIGPCISAAYLLSTKYNQQDRARFFLDQAYLIDSNSTVLLYVLALHNIGEKNYAEAEQLMKKAISLDSTNAETWDHLGSFYIQARRYTEAEAAFKKAITQDSTYFFAWMNLSTLYFNARRHTEAKPILEKAIVLDSTSAILWQNLGTLNKIARRHTEAEEQFKKAIQLDSTLTMVRLNLGDLYTSSRRFAEAEEQFKKCIELDSFSFLPFNQLGLNYTLTHRYSEAEAVFIKAIAIDSTQAWVWSNLGYIYLNLTRYPEAEAVLIRAIALGSALANPRKHLGMVYFKTDRPDEARQNFLKAIELNPNYKDAQIGMAYILVAEGITEEALSYVEQAIGKGSTFEQLENDEDLAPLRALPEWAALMQKHFPDQDKK